MNLERLKDKFSPMFLDWRVQACGETNGKIWARVLTYVDARAVQDRLDEVCGPENWQTSYQELRGGILCHISIKCGGEWVTKSDGAPATEVEPFKGGLSKALVRAASQWNVGRYLYSLDAKFAQIVDKGTPDAKGGKTKEGKVFFWLPPELPKWALPDAPKETPRPPAEKTALDLVNESPQSAKALHEDAKTQEKKKTAVELMQEKANELSKQPKQPPKQPDPIYCLCKKKMLTSSKGDFLYCPKWQDNSQQHKNPVPIKQ